MPTSRVSVIIPVYNCERYIADAIRSVQAQTHPPFEIIVVDDGSTDKTGAVVRACGTVKYLRQENRGEPAARNLGIEHAAGDLIAFLDGDDLWTPDKLAVQVPYLEEHPGYAMVYGDMTTFDDRGTIDESVKQRFHITFPEGNIFLPLFKETLFGSGSVVVRKECFHKVGPFDESLLVGSDYEMWLRIARNFAVGYVDRPVLMYRQHSSMSTLNLGRALQDGMPWEVLVLTKILARYPAIPAECGWSVINQRLAKPYACMGHTLLRVQDHANARRMFRKALRHWPTNKSYGLFYLATFARPSHLAAVRRIYGKLNRRVSEGRQPGGSSPVIAA